MNLLIETHSGSIQGFEENGLYKYLGIPYAEKPLGELFPCTISANHLS